MVRKSNQDTQSKGAGPAPAVEKDGPANLDVEFEAAGQGGGTLRLRYFGPIARFPHVWVRFGERREGRDWVEPRDISMTRVGRQASATIPCGAGSTLEGACFAFFALNDEGTEAWDSAGRAFGYYRFDVQTGSIEAR